MVLSEARGSSFGFERRRGRRRRCGRVRRRGRRVRRPLHQDMFPAAARAGDGGSCIYEMHTLYLASH